MLSSRSAVPKSKAGCPQRRRLQALGPLTPEVFKSVEEAQVARMMVAKALTMATPTLNVVRNFDGARCVVCINHSGQSTAVIVAVVSVLMTTIVPGLVAA